jgi:putative ATP-dependent endonuclease of OLD family
MIVDSNGNGITRIITNYLNRSKYNENLVKHDLLQNLNKIMGEDANFTEVVTQQIDSAEGTKWEIYLREEGKGRIPLSESGSGLKTILMVLVFTILIPNVEHKKISQYIFLFEELENNLHPSLQRRLLKYIENLTEEGALFFLTTHSNVTLDAYQNSDITNIIHLQKEESQVNLINITNKIQKNSILNDLGIKASDLLQSNGIIWVEGPSDRVYINNWIKIHKKANIIEGKDYQCVFYGGRLLSNLSLEDENELVNLMSVNRNAIIVLDSDKKGNNAPLNKTKKRIIEEAKKQGILVWVTKGREIENYIPELLIKKKYNKKNSKCSFGQFQNVEEFIDKLKKGEGNKFLRDKINFAKDITTDCNWECFKDCYDLDKMITKIESKVLDWNNDK